MANTTKYNDDVRQKAYALMTINNNDSDIGRQLGIPKETICSWRRRMEKDPKKLEEFTRLHEEKKREFAAEAWKLIDTAVQLTCKRLERALSHEAALDSLIKDIASDDQLAASAKKQAIEKIKTLEIQNVRELSTLIGTMYDKQALAMGESTSNVGVNGEIKDMSREEILAALEAYGAEPQLKIAKQA